MTDLELAARAASEATGLDVHVGDTAHDGGLCFPAIVVWSPIDEDEQPTESRAFKTDAEAIAYCEGLEAGARIATERHRIECWEQARTVLRELEATK